MMDVLVGLVLLLSGVVIAGYGIKAFFALLPLLGFLVGFAAGASVVSHVTGDSFLATVLGWIVGIAVGLLFMAFSYLWWYVGAILAAASTGAFVATAIASMIGMRSGTALITFGLIGAILVAVIAIRIALPVYVVVVNTAIVGAATATAGLMLVVNTIDRVNLENGFGYAIADVSWVWNLVWMAIAVVGIGMQLALVRTVRLPDDQWSRAT